MTNTVLADCDNNDMASYASCEVRRATEARWMKIRGVSKILSARLRGCRSSYRTRRVSSTGLGRGVRDQTGDQTEYARSNSCLCECGETVTGRRRRGHSHGLHGHGTFRFLVVLSMVLSFNFHSSLHFTDHGHSACCVETSGTREVRAASGGATLNICITQSSRRRLACTLSL